MESEYHINILTGGCWSLKTIEEEEYQEFIRIRKHILDRFENFLDGLNSRISLKDDWWNIFTAYKSRENFSDLDKGAERIAHHIYSYLYSRPLSVPIGADLMYETYKSIVHIDVKTISSMNILDYKGKINTERNQTSYSCSWFKANLPQFYSKFFKQRDKKCKKLCLTYFIYILHEVGTSEIISIMLINIPNGALSSLYGEKIISAGKGGRLKASNARFLYKNFLYYKTLGKEYPRVVFLYKRNDMSQEELTGIKTTEFSIPVDIYG